MLNLRDTSCTCPRWGCEGVMEWIRVDGCFRCPECGCEIWGQESRTVSTKEAREVMRLHHAYIGTIRKHGGGSKSAGRKRKPKPKINPEVSGVMPGFRDYDGG